MTRRPDRNQAGAATVLAISFMAVILMTGSACGLAVALVSDHRRAQSAADLAALAGAVALGRGEDACARAGEVALANGAQLMECLVTERDVTVRAVVTGPSWFGLSADLSGRARAGPG